MEIQNIFSIGDANALKDEVFEDIIRKPGLLVERIVSTGQSSPEGFWYDQEQDEWVLLLQGTAILEIEGSEPCRLIPGDYILLPARCRHRVLFTSTSPACVWLALHGHLT